MAIKTNSTSVRQGHDEPALPAFHSLMRGTWRYDAIVRRARRQRRAPEDPARAAVACSLAANAHSMRGQHETAPTHSWSAAFTRLSAPDDESPLAQHRAIAECAKRHGYRIIAEFTDGATCGSGSPERTTFLRVFDLISLRTEGFSRQYMRELARISRFQAQRLHSLLKYRSWRRGVQIRY